MFIGVNLDVSVDLDDNTIQATDPDEWQTIAERIVADALKGDPRIRLVYAQHRKLLYEAPYQPEPAA